MFEDILGPAKPYQDEPQTAARIAEDEFVGRNERMNKEINGFDVSSKQLSSGDNPKQPTRRPWNTGNAAPPKRPWRT
jgi:hypothetical protein